jgi:uncharacterized protein YceK
MPTHHRSVCTQLWFSGVAVLTALTLTGCGTVMRVDSVVQSHAQWLYLHHK